MYSFLAFTFNCIVGITVEVCTCIR